MRRIRGWIGRFAGLFGKQGRDVEIDAEIESHLQLHIDDNVRRGMSPEAARREALIHLGGIDATKEAYRDQRGFPWVEALLQEIRHGARTLRKQPGFTIAAVATLALGIGANTTIFSVIEGVLLRPLPYHKPERLVTVCESSPRRGLPQVLVTPGIFRDWREQNSSFEELGGQIYESVNLTGIERPEHLHAAWTTPNYFEVFGVAPLLGRTFSADDKPSNYRMVVLSYGLWQRSFGGDRQVIGRAINLNGQNYTVIGVMPANFRIYQPAAIFGLPTGEVQPQLWMPYPGSMDERGYHYFLAFARLKAGVTTAQARNELDALVKRSVREWPLQKDWGASVRPLDMQIVGGARPALLLLLGVVGFVLLIACANVANLSLARAAGRAREFAVRSALGAARWRLACQLLAESTLIALLGGVLGIALAYWGLAALTKLQPASLPRLDEVWIDRAVLLFTLLISLATAVIFGLVPALQASNPELQQSLKEGGPGSSHGRHSRLVRKFLVVAEVTFATILLAGAGLMIHSFARLTSVEPGFTPEKLMAFDFSISGRAYENEPTRIELVRRLRERVQSRLGLDSVASVYGLPFGTMLNAVVGVKIDGGKAAESPEIFRSAWRIVSPNYFQTMQVPLFSGRLFSEKLDGPTALPAAIINQAFADKYFPGQNPLGRRLQIVTLGTNWHEVIGVIKDVKLTRLDSPATPELYECDAQTGQWMFSLVVRSSLGRGIIEEAVRAEAAAVDRDLPPFNIRTMEQAISTSMASRRFTTLLIGLFAGLSLTLAAVGIYSVVSYTVSERTREIGVRMALGASRRDVLGLVLRQGMGLVVAGILAGLAGSLALRGLIAAQLFGVAATDPITLMIVVALLSLIAAAACYLPARQAAKFDPMVLLRDY